MIQKRLGKGLEALISEVLQPQEQKSVVSQDITFIDITQLQPSKFQPRKKFDTEKLQQLADSIKSSGIIEPLIVCPVENNKYEIVCGERRYRAALLAKLQSVPVVIKHLNEEQKYIISLIENIQREDLNPVEEAIAYKKLIEEYKLTQEKLAELLGKDRSVIANTLRILNLPQEVLGYIEDGLITAGHARSLASLDSTELIKELAEKIVQDKLTVRDIERIVQKYKGKKYKKQEKFIPAEIKQIEQELQEIFGTKVRIITGKNNKGRIVIHYYSLENFENIIKKFKQKNSTL